MDSVARVVRVSIVAVAIAFLHDSATAQTSRSIPDYPGQVMLIKNTITAVNHGNITGNFTVLRDLASERFRNQNTAADLAVTFANLKSQKLDLSPILVTEPKLTQQPSIDEFRHRLQLVGFFPTRPQAVQFALIFQQIDAGWVIDEISLQFAPTESLVQQPPPPQPPPSAQEARRPVHTPPDSAPQRLPYR